MPAQRDRVSRELSPGIEMATRIPAGKRLSAGERCQRAVSHQQLLASGQTNREARIMRRAADPGRASGFASAVITGEA